MKKIYILLTKYSDWASCMFYYFSGRGYTHASIGLEDDKNRFFSFNFKGFCVETTAKHRRKGVLNSIMYEIEVPCSTYEEIQQKIDDFMRNREIYSYTKIGAFFAILHIPFYWKYHYICSQFVAELLKSTGAVPLKRRASLYMPNQLRPELDSCKGLYRVVYDPI